MTTTQSHIYVKNIRRFYDRRDAQKKGIKTNLTLLSQINCVEKE